MLSAKSVNLMIFETLGPYFRLCLGLMLSVKVLSGLRVDRGSANSPLVVLMMLPLSQKHQS